MLDLTPRVLLGFYGTKRLNIVNEYVEQWHLGKEAQSVEIKKENAGCYRANTWLREKRTFEN